jgi:hypothetical protein
MTDNWSDEQTDDPLYANDRGWYAYPALLYSGNNLDKAREIFVTTVKHRPGIRLTIRQRTWVLDEWPPRE